jgi:hypothetical protein
VTAGTATFKGQDLFDLAPEDRSHKGLFLSFQSPIEIPGVSNVDFLRMAYNARQKSQGKPELEPIEFYAHVIPKVRPGHCGLTAAAAAAGNCGSRRPAAAAPPSSDRGALPGGPRPCLLASPPSHMPPPRSAPPHPAPPRPTPPPSLSCSRWTPPS